MISDTTVRMIGIQMPAVTTADRIIDMVPEVLDRIDRYADRFGAAKKETASDTE